jgi:rubrerythrin
MAENTQQTDPTGILEGYAPHDHYSPPESERDLVSECMQRFDEAEKARSYWEQDADFFLNFLRGNQLILRSVATNEVLRVAVAQGNTKRLHSIDNVLRPVARALTGKLTRIIPGVEVLPATTEQDDLRSSEVANAFLDYMARKEQLRKKFLRSMKQLPWAGTSLIELSWNKRAGQNLAWCKTCSWTGPEEQAGQPCPLCAEQQQAQMQQQMAMQQGMMQPGMQPGMQPPQQEVPTTVKINEGDVEVTVRDPRDCFPEPGQPEVTKMRWFVTREPVAVSDARRCYPHKAKHIHAEDGIYTDRTIGFYGQGFTGHNETQFLQDHVYLYTFHEAPTSKYERGRLIRILNSMIVEQSEHPLYFLRRLPFYVSRFETNDGEFWGESPIAHAWHMQRELNKLLTQCRTVRELTFNPQKLVPMQSRITTAEWDDQPGRHIRYNPIGGKPAYLEIQQFPAYVYAEIDRLARSIMNKFGVTDEEMGYGQGRESGRFAAIQEAQSSEAIAPIMVDNGTEWLELHRGILQAGQHYYTPERAWTVTGRDRVISHTWSEMNLLPGWDIELVEEDSLSKNPALRLQEALELLQAGVFTDPLTGIVDIKAFKRSAGLRLPGIAPDMNSSERAYADSIPEQIKRGGQFVPRPWDDCEIIVESLTAWLRGPGRNEDPVLVDMVGRIWVAYADILKMQQRPMDETIAFAPGPMVGQQQAPQPGGAPGGGGVMQQGGQPGPQQPNSPQADAARMVQQADQSGEQLARRQARHEG